ncbi:MAG: hypothetical protein OXH70_17350 [Acidobacteria bacterium]|nr:hypothetical protein [Acidobacteriota bacterium]
MNRLKSMVVLAALAMPSTLAGTEIDDFDASWVFRVPEEDRLHSRAADGSWNPGFVFDLLYFTAGRTANTFNHRVVFDVCAVPVDMAVRWRKNQDCSFPAAGSLADRNYERCRGSGDRIRCVAQVIVFSPPLDGRTALWFRATEHRSYRDGTEGYSEESYFWPPVMLNDPRRTDVCEPTESVICLLDGAVELTAYYWTQWDLEGVSGKPAKILDSSPGDTSLARFYFFSPGNVELDVKVIPCVIRAPTTYVHAWLFAAGMTNLPWQIVVRNRTNEWIFAWELNDGKPPEAPYSSSLALTEPWFPIAPEDCGGFVYP